MRKMNNNNKALTRRERTVDNKNDRYIRTLRCKKMHSVFVVCVIVVCARALHRISFAVSAVFGFSQLFCLDKKLQSE